jgi:hypothetical protein
MAWTTPGTATAGEVLTAAFWNTNVRDNSDALYRGQKELVHAIETGSPSTAATTFATGIEIFTDQTFTSDGTRHLVELYIPAIQNTSSAGYAAFELSNGGATSLGILAYAYNPVSLNGPVHAKYYFTPAAGSVTLNVKAYVNTGNVFVQGGPGGAGAIVQRFLRVTRANQLA